jgi:hypothetical protein
VKAERRIIYTKITFSATKKPIGRFVGLKNTLEKQVSGADTFTMIGPFYEAFFET